jgi:predicted nuclease with TOPRIM domain
MDDQASLSKLSPNANAESERIIRDKLTSRMQQLKTEFQTGQDKLLDLDLQQSRLRETLLRISGAIQVLEEMLQAAKPNEQLAPQGSPPAERSSVGQG